MDLSSYDAEEKKNRYLCSKTLLKPSQFYSKNKEIRSESIKTIYSLNYR